MSGAGGITGTAPERTWTVLDLIRWSGEYLGEKGVPQGRLDAEHLLAHALGTRRMQLYLDHDRPLTSDELAAFKPLLLRRARREPLQHIVGRVGFRELELTVDARVLVPRPETEELVGVVLAHTARGEGLVALDVGTGSGCIALSLLHEGPYTRVVGTDISRDALDVARANAAATPRGGALELRQGSLFEPVAAERFDVVVANPPYVDPEDRPGLEAEVRDWEPAAALFAPERGLSLLHALVYGAPDHLVPGGLLALEVGAGQDGSVVEAVVELGAYHEPEVGKDLAGRRRFVTARRRD